MPDDLAQNILSPVQVDNSIKAGAWEAFNSAKNENELGVRLQGIDLPQETKAQLWEAKKSSGLQMPNAAMQAHQQLISSSKKLMDVSGYRELMNAKPAINPDINATLGTLPAVGMTVGGALGGVPGAGLGGGAGEAASQLIRRAGSTPQQNQISDLSRAAGGPMQSPAADITKQTAIGATAEAGGKYVLSPLLKWGGKQIARLAGETPERIAWLQKYFPAKEAVEQKVVQAEAASREAFKQAYPKIDASPVNLQNTRAAVDQATTQLKAFSTPRPVSQVGNLPMPTQAQAIRQIPAGEMMPHPEEILERLGKYDNVPFRDAQQYRTAIEQYITKNKPPAPVYNALKQVANSLETGLRATAEKEGVLAQFDNANAMFKAHAADFWNKGAPLKPYLNAAPGTKPSNLNRFLQTSNDSRALSALERRGVDTTDLRELMAKGTARDVKDAATMKNLGESVLNQQVGAANTAVAKKYAAGAVGGAIGAGGLTELIRWLATKPKQSP